MVTVQCQLRVRETMVNKMTIPLAAFACILLAMQSAPASSVIKHVFVITMENTDADQIYGKPKRAPFINKSIIPKFARATNFNDPLPDQDSEPHYIWMEAGTNVFSDHTFNSDDPPSAENSTASKNHLV